MTPRHSTTLRLPRNYNFISRLPDVFEVKIIKKVNTIPEGTWYLCTVKEHELNILSQIKLVAGKSYKIRKKDELTLELLGKNFTDKSTGSNDDHGYYS